MASLTKDRLIFDPADLTESDNIGAYVRAGSDGDLVSSTNVGGKEGLDVNVINSSIVVSATDLDIRDLVYTQDSVTAYQGGSWSATVSATDFDIRDLSASQDNVAISDGTDTLAVNADGSINVNATFSTEYAEDSAHSSGDQGNFFLAVRHDANTSMVDTDGDYAPLQVDSLGRLKVAAEIAVNSDYIYAEDSAHTTGDLGAYVLGVRQDSLASSVSTDGDYGSMKFDSRGAMWTAPVGTAADDAADTENPVKIGFRATNAALSAVSAADDRVNAISDMYRRLFINDSPNIGAASVAVTVGTSEVALPSSALAGRRRMMIQNVSANDIYIGPTGVLTSSGLRVSKGSTLSLEVGENVVLYGIAGSAGNSIRVFELA